MPYLGKLIVNQVIAVYTQKDSTAKRERENDSQSIPQHCRVPNSAILKFLRVTGNTRPNLYGLPRRRFFIDACASVNISNYLGQSFDELSFEINADKYASSTPRIKHIVRSTILFEISVRNHNLER